MMKNLYRVLRPFIFLFAPEFSHNLALRALKLAPRQLFAKIPDSPSTHMGLTFKNPIGLAAGLDKNGDYIDALAKLGFGFIELGTVTPLPQPGNRKPRMFRLPQAQAIINRMGFNNKGVDYLVERVKSAKYTGVIGINIGKNKATPMENAVDDYLIGLRKVYAVADYITVNISSPNTPGLRTLQLEPLAELLDRLCEEKSSLKAVHGREVPLLVKLAPDNTVDELKSMAKIINQYPVAGVIATNTTIARDMLPTGTPHAQESGGLSGQAMYQKANQALQALRSDLNEDCTIIGVGGINSAQTAVNKLQLGADLIQIYTGLIYRGPSLVDEISAACEHL